MIIRPRAALTVLLRPSTRIFLTDLTREAAAEWRFSGFLIRLGVSCFFRSFFRDVEAQVLGTVARGRSRQKTRLLPGSPSETKRINPVKVSYEARR